MPSPPPPDPDPGPAVAEPTPPPPPGGGVNLATLMQIIAGLAVGLALLAQAPPLGATALTFAGIALAHTVWADRARRRDGRPLTRRERDRIFLLAFAACWVIGLSGLIAITAICFPLGLAALATNHLNGFWIAVLAGLAAGLASMWSTFRLFRSRRNPEDWP